MQISIEWHEVVVRLAAAVIAGGLIGFNREEHGRAGRLVYDDPGLRGRGHLDDPGQSAVGTPPAGRAIRSS